MVSDSGNGGDWSAVTKAGLIKGGIFAAIICSIIIGWGLLKSAEYERESNNRLAEYAEYNSEKIILSCVRIAPIERRKCVDQAFAAQRDYEATQYDLEAQRKTALWAYVTGAAAVIGMALSAVGVWLVKTTFDETKLANSNFQEEMYHRLRAYLQCEIAELYPGSRSIPPTKPHVVWKNFGQTPAINFGMLNSVRVVEANLAIDQIFADFPNVKRVGGRTVVQGNVKKFFGAALSTDDLRSVYKKTHRIFLLSRVEYTDTIFLKEHISQECWEIRIDNVDLDKEGNGAAIAYKFVEAPDFSICT